MADLASSDEGCLNVLQRYLPILRQTAPCVITAVICSLICGNQGLFLTVYIAVSAPFLLSAMNNNQVLREDIKNAVVNLAKQIMAIFTTPNEENPSVLQQYLPTLRQMAPFVMMMTVLSSLICGNQGGFLVACVAVFVLFLATSANTNHVSNGGVSRGISIGIFQITISKTRDNWYSNNQSTNCTNGISNRRRCTERDRKVERLTRRRNQRSSRQTMDETGYEEDDEDSRGQIRHKMFRMKKLRIQDNYLSAEGILSNKNPNRSQNKKFAQKDLYDTDGTDSSYSDNESTRSNEIASAECLKEPGQTSRQNYPCSSLSSSEHELSKLDEPDVMGDKDESEKNPNRSQNKKFAQDLYDTNAVCLKVPGQTSRQNYPCSSLSSSEHELSKQDESNVVEDKDESEKFAPFYNELFVCYSRWEDFILGEFISSPEHEVLKFPDKDYSLNIKVFNHPRDVAVALKKTNHGIVEEFKMFPSLMSYEERYGASLPPNPLVDEKLIKNVNMRTVALDLVSKSLHRKAKNVKMRTFAVDPVSKSLRRKAEKIKYQIIGDLVPENLCKFLYKRTLVVSEFLFYLLHTDGITSVSSCKTMQALKEVYSAIALIEQIAEQDQQSIRTIATKIFLMDEISTLTSSCISMLVSTLEQERLDEPRDRSINDDSGRKYYRFSSKYIGMTEIEAPVEFRNELERSGEKQEALLNFNIQVRATQLAVTYISPSDGQTRVVTIGTIQSIESGDVHDIRRKLSELHFSVGIASLREFQQNRVCGKAPRMYELNPRIFIDALRQNGIEVEDFSTSQNEDLLRYRLHFPEGCRMVITVPMNRPDSKELETSKG